MKKETIREIVEWSACIIIAVVLALTIKFYVGTPTLVKHTSMYPTLKDGEILLLSKISYKLHDLERFDVVVIKEDDWIIKRVIGLPGDNVSYKDNELYINDKLVEDKHADGLTKDFDLDDIWIAGEMEGKTNFKEPFETIPEGYYLVLGDNREISKDSRSVGLIPMEEIKGKAVVRFWPLTKISMVK